MARKFKPDLNKLPESDPHFKRFFQIDEAKRKMRLQMFADRLKQVYPNAVPYLNIKSPELCDQCEKRTWTRQYWIKKNMNQGMLFVVCDECWPALEDEADKRRVTMKLLRQRNKAGYFTREEATRIYCQTCKRYVSKDEPSHQMQGHSEIFQ